MSDDVAWHHKVPSPEQVATALAELEALVMTTTAAPTDRVLHDCRDAYVATLIDLADADTADRRGGQRLGRVQQARRLRGEVRATA